MAFELGQIRYIQYIELFRIQRKLQTTNKLFLAYTKDNLETKSCSLCTQDTMFTYLPLQQYLSLYQATSVLMHCSTSKFISRLLDLVTSFPLYNVTKSDFIYQTKHIPYSLLGITDVFEFIFVYVSERDVTLGKRMESDRSGRIHTNSRILVYNHYSTRLHCISLYLSTADTSIAGTLHPATRSFRIEKSFSR